MLQDDTYTESYISTIGVDFVSAYLVHVHIETLCNIETIITLFLGLR